MTDAVSLLPRGDPKISSPGHPPEADPWGLAATRLRRIRTQLLLGAIQKLGFPPDPGRNRPKTPYLIRKMAVRTLPRTPRGEGGQEQK